MKWSILILTIPGREKLLQRLLDRLEPQIKGNPEIETVVLKNLGSIGEGRQKLLEKSRGEYVCFVDDDDLVDDNYIERIFPLLDGVDYVGFQVMTFRDGKLYGVAYHSLKHKDWRSGKMYSERDISHLNPIRRELALQAQMEGDFGEDGRWANRLRELGIVKTEHYIPEVMYFYYIRTHKPEMMPA